MSDTEADGRHERKCAVFWDNMGKTGGCQRQTTKNFRAAFRRMCPASFTMPSRRSRAKTERLTGREFTCRTGRLPDLRRAHTLCRTIPTRLVSVKHVFSIRPKTVLLVLFHHGKVRPVNPVVPFCCGKVHFLRIQKNNMIDRCNICCYFISDTACRSMTRTA